MPSFTPTKKAQRGSTELRPQAKTAVGFLTTREQFKRCSEFCPMLSCKYSGRSILNVLHLEKFCQGSHRSSKATLRTWLWFQVSGNLNDTSRVSYCALQWDWPFKFYKDLTRRLLISKDVENTEWAIAAIFESAMRKPTDDAIVDNRQSVCAESKH